MFASLCADVLGPGFARPGTDIDIRTPTGGQPVSHVVDITSGGLMAFFVICLYTGTGPGSLAISFGMSLGNVFQKSFHKIELMAY